MNRTSSALLLAALLALVATTAARAADDPYETYLKTSRDFRPVKQDAAWALKAFPTWVYMPWTYQWTIGYTEASGRWSVENGYNGAFIDWDRIGTPTSKTGKLDWIDQFHLRFYVDHFAAKRYLHLWDGNDMKPHANEVHGTGVRIQPLNAALERTLRGYIQKHIAAVKSSPNRAAYALDDEISWGHFVHPCMWCATDDKAAYPAWLKEVYGPNAPRRDAWIGYNDIQPKLKTWTIATFDASPLMDQWTFNDAIWANFVGDLVEYANSLDPDTPCGFVGGQAPNAFGGYDYARLMRKVQFLEAYNIGSSQAIARSFNPHNGLPLVTTHFHKNVADTVWQTWYYLVHGNRGFIGWVENWFDGDQPKPWHAQVAPHYREAGQKIGPLLAGATWIHDGVAIYYSHPSIQLGWIMDAEAHGKSWTNRNGDARLGSSHHVRKAWENMLRDEGVQYNFLSYVDVVQKGVPAEYKVVILPAALCLSDAEARQLRAFVERGGTLLADYLPGVWDQHGKGRAGGGALDDVFGVKHDPAMRAGDIFGDKLWVEVDQDANFSWKTYEQFLTSKNTCVKDASGFNKAVRALDVVKVNKVGRGTAVLFNLSPQWYNAYRVEGFAAAAKRAVFMQPVLAAGAVPWVRLKDAGDREHGYEITYWKKGDRTIVCVCFNPEVIGNELGGGNSAGLKTQTIPIALAFAKPVSGVRDERAGKDLGAGQEFKFDWTMNEAVVVSFAGAPSR